MPRSNVRSSGPARLADRVAAVQRRRFVGRVGELELFRSALSEPEPPFAVLYLYGPGGVGKTTLLGEYERLAAEAEVTVIRLDGRHLDPSPAGFLAALAQALDLRAGEAPLDVLAREPSAVLLLDTYEVLTPLDAWLRESFLPHLPERSLVVIAGRNPPASAWRTDPGWRDLVRIVSLRNLRPEESRAYLAARGVPEARHEAVLAFTHGHPLALALVADVLTQEGAAALNPEQDPDVVRVLLERFLAHVPSARHRQALEICAHTRVTTEELLAEALGGTDAGDLFQWLRELSFMEQGRQGLFPHDVVRDVLDLDFRWRNPQGYRRMHFLVRDFVVRNIAKASQTEKVRFISDLLYLHRQQPLMKPFYDWQALGTTYVEAATPDDYPAILEMAERHEGTASARIVRHWLARQPEAFTVTRPAPGPPTGFLVSLAIHHATGDDLEVDPAIQAAWDYARRHGPVRAGEEMLYHRFWMERDGYQSAAVHNLAATVALTHWLSNPRLAWTFVAVGDAEFWEPMFTYVNHPRRPEAEFEVGGHRYGVFAHDWRVEPLDMWLRVMGERELATGLTLEEMKADTQTPALVVLSQPDFEDGVRRALRDYTRPDALATNPLLRSRLVVERAGERPQPADLQAVLREAAEVLRANLRDEKLYRAVHRTYLEPAPTQEAAAELLDLPFSTYRRHLTAGVQRITEWLWQRELYGM
ncbi:MAG TPA: ATP-binding protein [Dehalococcoidia bacterium]